MSEIKRTRRTGIDVSGSAECRNRLQYRAPFCTKTETPHINLRDIKCIGINNNTVKLLI